MTEAQIDGLLHQQYGADPWHYFSQVRAGTGFAQGADRTIDGLAVNVWPSQFRIAAFEIKCTRADFLNEIQKPGKRGAFTRQVSEFWYVTPAGLIAKDELPVGCGLMEVHGDVLKRMKLATQREIQHVPVDLFRSLVRKKGQAYKGVAMFKHAGEELTDEDLAALVEKRAKEMADVMVSTNSTIRWDLDRLERFLLSEREQIGRTLKELRALNKA